MENANGDGWREELYLKIKSIRELCLPHLSDLHQTAVDKLDHQESLPPQQRSDQFEKLKQFKTKLERMIQFLSVPKSNIMPALKHNIACYEKQIMDLLMMQGPRQLPQSQTIHGMQQNASSSKPGSSLEPGQGSGQNNGYGGDWQEQVFQKIQRMKLMYLTELTEIYQRVASKVHQHDSVPQQQRSDEFEKLTQLKTMLERMMQFLSVPKGNIMPALKDKLDYYEKQIIGFLNMHRPRKTVHLPQLSQSQMQQPQSLNIQDQSTDNQKNPQMQSMSMQVSGPRALKSSLPYMQNNVLSSLPGVSAPQQNIPSFTLASSLESGQGTALSCGQQVLAMGSMQQNTSHQVNNGSASAQRGLGTLQSNANQTQLSSIVLQNQQQQDQLLHLKRQFQYRQMQQQQLLQLIHQQQLPQQLTQQLKQQFQYRQMQQKQLQQQVIQLQQQLQARQQDQQMRQQLQQQFQPQQQQQNMSSSSIAASNLESGQGNALNNTNGGDWREEVFQKITSMKEKYLADLTELYQIVVATVQQDSLPPQQRADDFEKQKQFKTVLWDMIRFLNVSKNYLLPAFKDHVDYIETQIIRYLTALRRPAQGN